MNNDFSRVKIGDRLWSPYFGWAVVTELTTVAITVKTKDDDVYIYNINGRPYDCPDYPQSLFLEEMEMIPIAKPDMKSEEVKVFDPTKPYQRRDGVSCQIVHTTKEGQFIVIVPETDAVYYCYSNGQYLSSSEHNADLINIPENMVIEGWINIYKVDSTYHTGNLHTIKEEAKSICDSNESDKRDVVARKLISFTEGEGL